MKKLSASVAALLIAAGIIWYVASGQGTSSQTAQTTPAANTAIDQNSSSGQPTTAANYKDGSYTGQVFTNEYGDVQVRAIISGGKLSDIKFLALPSDHERSVMLSSYSSTRLRQEALQAQSANVDIISGATATSEGFRESLKSALNNAS